MNDLTYHLTYGRLTSCADDSQILHNARPECLSDLKFQIETDLASLSEWFYSNELKVNAEKTDFLVAGTCTSKAASLEVNFDGIALPHSESIKFEGFTLDRHVCWDKQVSAVAQRM